MKKVPFFENTPNDKRCALAVYRMLYKYFKDQDLTWNELDEMSGFHGDIAAWTVKIWARMAAEGFDIRMVEAFDLGDMFMKVTPILGSILIVTPTIGRLTDQIF